MFNTKRVSSVELKICFSAPMSSAAKRRYQKFVSNIENDMSKVNDSEPMSFIEENKPTLSNSDIQKTYDLYRLTNTMKEK